jgi:signal transduction histidine kinase
MDIKKANHPDLQAFCNALLENITFGIIVLDLDGKISILNSTAKNLLEINVLPDQLIAQNVMDSVDHFPVLKDSIFNALKKGGKSFNLEAEPLNNKFLDIIGKYILNSYLLIIYDVTIQKDLKANSILSMISGQENERRRIAREIHDGFGPVLSAVKLELDSFIDEHDSSLSDASLQKLIDIGDTLDSINIDLRNLSHHLVPRLLDEFGLLSALNSLTVRLNKASTTNIEFYSNLDSGTRFEQDLELNLYRCGQELISNALKYAKANSIIVQLILHKNSIMLMVEDDGIGFTRHEEAEKDYFGIGLTNVETRIRILGGEFRVDSFINKGTTASIEIPL